MNTTIPRDPHTTAVEPAGTLELLPAVEDCLREAVGTDGMWAQACAHLVLAPASKRVRPRLVLAFAALGASNAMRGTSALATPAVRAAAAVELIHTASLMHDDVVDLATERRGRASVNARWGNHVAVLAGDVLLSRALRLLAFDTHAVSEAIDVVGAMSIAAVREVEARGQASLSLEDHAAISDGKTAALFGLCGRLAGMVLDDADASVRFAAAARALGLAFQLADDVGDVEADLVERTPTHPILSAAALDAHVLRALETLWRRESIDAHEARQLAAAIVAGPGVSASLESIRANVEVARAALVPWAGTPGHRDIFTFADTLQRPKTGF